MLKNRTKGILQSLGPGLLWAGAAIGVSHLVQSTRAGAHYGFALIWIVIVANILKYPFFEFGPRYAAARGESLLEGYRRLGRWALWLFLILTIGAMFTIQAAVTVVTAGLAAQLTGIALTPVAWSAILLAICVVVLIIGKYPALDMLIKIIIITLTLSTIAAVVSTLIHGRILPSSHIPPQAWDAAGIAFIVALVGWMPSAFDIAVWNSEWTLERHKQTGHRPSIKEALFDFNLGYLGTAFLAVCFLTLGAMVMYGTGEKFSPAGGVFAGQFINLYTQSLGGWSCYVIIIAAFTTMFSTTLTVLDGFPRVLKRTTNLLLVEYGSPGERKWLYWLWMGVVLAGALLLLSLLRQTMRFNVDLATAISFVTAPILAIMNYKVVTGQHMPPDGVPPGWLRALSWIGIVFLTAFSLGYLWWRFL